MSEIYAGPRESQRLVRELTAIDISDEIDRRGGIESLDVDQAKLFEYALLVKPITGGLRDYLDNYKKPDKREHTDALTLMDRIGAGLGIRILSQVRSDSESLRLIYQLSQHRATLLPEPVAKNISPIVNTLISASKASVDALYDSAVATYLAIPPQIIDEMSREDRIEIVKKSVELPVKRAFAALSWQQAISENIFRSTVSQADRALTFDEAKMSVRMTSPITNWPDHLGHSGIGSGSTIGDIAPEDVHIGCPVSFSPKIVAEYYRHVVDLIEYHQAWPDFMNDQEIMLPIAKL